jgi:hypothetical protein
MNFAAGRVAGVCWALSAVVSSLAPLSAEARDGAPATLHQDLRRDQAEFAQQLAAQQARRAALRRAQPKPVWSFERQHRRQRSLQHRQQRRALASSMRRSESAATRRARARNLRREFRAEQRRQLGRFRSQY